MGHPEGATNPLQHIERRNISNRHLSKPGQTLMVYFAKKKDFLPHANLVLYVLHQPLGSLSFTSIGYDVKLHPTGGTDTTWWDHSWRGGPYKIPQCCSLQSKASYGCLKTHAPTALWVLLG